MIDSMTDLLNEIEQAPFIYSLAEPPIYVTSDILSEVIETREPEDLFYTIHEDGVCVGVDNTRSDAFTEAFPYLSVCLYWLTNQGFDYNTETDFKKYFKGVSAMEKHKVVIQEVLEKEIEIEAISLKEATLKAEKMYHDEIVILDENDFQEVNFSNF